MLVDREKTGQKGFCCPMFGNKNINAYFCERYIKKRLWSIGASFYSVLNFDVVSGID